MTAAPDPVERARSTAERARRLLDLMDAHRVRADPSAELLEIQLESAKGCALRAADICDEYLAGSRNPKLVDVAYDFLVIAIRQAKVAFELARIEFELPSPRLPGAAGAGEVTERTVQSLGDDLELVASPRPSRETPYYYPGGGILGFRAPAGFVSSPWWLGVRISVDGGDVRVLAGAVMLGLVGAKAVEVGGGVLAQWLSERSSRRNSQGDWVDILF